MNSPLMNKFSGSSISSRQALLQELGPHWQSRQAVGLPTLSNHALDEVEALTIAPPSDSVADLNWDELKAAVQRCTACGLCESRKQTVFGVGDQHADWLLVGEAPGAEEDARGEPFVGQAGRLLDNMLRALSLQRAQNVYIANVLKCRPPNNRNPEAAEVAKCEPFLRRQIALLQPKLIVVMGRFAAQSLLQTEATIASLRGQVHRYTLSAEQAIPVVVTYHPAYLLRNLPDKAKAWADWSLAAQVWHDQQA